MIDVAKQHQLKIAKRTLRMTPAGARIMGGMDFETAYMIVFRTSLRDRLDNLVAEYGEAPEWLSWELGAYGWDNPKELLDQLN